jgi:hypothetical protein
MKLQNVTAMFRTFGGVVMAHANDVRFHFIYLLTYLQGFFGWRQVIVLA